MSGDAAEAVVVVGVPQSLRQLIERDFKGRATIRCILMHRDGGFRLEGPAVHVCRLIDEAADRLETLTQLFVIELPYARVPVEVCETVDALAGLGAEIVRPKPGSDDWPSRPPKLDKDFQDALRTSIRKAISDRLTSRSVPDRESIVCFELLRGLATHSKMGPNNHSHEDDLWKSRGMDLGPGGRQRIVDRLLAEGVIGRKKNNSAGGTGWVYWIADVRTACNLYPQLRQYVSP